MTSFAASGSVAADLPGLSVRVCHPFLSRRTLPRKSRLTTFSTSSRCETISDVYQFPTIITLAARRSVIGAGDGSIGVVEALQSSIRLVLKWKSDCALCGGGKLSATTFDISGYLTVRQGCADYSQGSPSFASMKTGVSYCLLLNGSIDRMSTILRRVSVYAIA